VSAERIISMLSNRHQTADAVASALNFAVDVEHLVAEDSELSYDELLTLAKHFKRPWSYFLIDGPEVLHSAGQDNRSVGNQRRDPSPAVLDEIEAVAEMLDAAAELFPETRFEIPPLRITAHTPPAAAGDAIRAFLGVSFEHQLSTKDGFGALRLWGNALQGRGVYVSQRRIRDETIRAFSRVAGEQAVVVVDTGDTAYARVFSLIHEYCHVILRTTGLCDLDDHSSIEQHCNAVAAATLMPPALIRDALAGRRFGNSADDDDRLIQRLSRKVGVSQQALLIRLRELGVLDEGSFDALEYRRSQRRADQERTPGGTYYPPRINRVGRRYAHNVLGALDERRIDRQDASALLEIGEHLLGSYRRVLDGEGGAL